MHLLIDEGNTKSKFAICTSYKDLSPVTEEQALQQLESVKSIVLSSVVAHSRCEKLLSNAKARKLTITKVSVQAEEYGIICAYDKPSNLGIDRWLAILGAELLFPEHNLLIIDAGTAITCDLVTNDKRHLGGWITPGLMLMRTTIVEKAPGVFSNDEIEEEVFGTDTPSALYQGCVNACVGTVERSHKRAIEVLKSSTLITLMTGGDADLINKELSFSTKHVGELVFIGMSRFIRP